MAPHSSTLAWKIPWTEEPGRLQSMGLLRVGHNWATSFSLFTSMHWRRKWQRTPVFLPGESQGQRSLVGCYLWVAQSRTRLKQLSSNSRIPSPKSMEVCGLMGCCSESVTSYQIFDSPSLMAILRGPLPGRGGGAWFSLDPKYLLRH